MRKIIISLFFLVLFVPIVFINNGLAKVKVTVKNYGGANGLTNPSISIPALESAVARELKKYINDESKISKGFANSNACASRVADFNGYHGYEVFGLLFGFNSSAQLPDSDLSNLDKYFSSQIEDKLNKYNGFGYSGGLNVGMNASRFGLKLFKRELYFNLKFYYLKDKIDPGIVGIDFSPVATEILTLGIGANLQLIKPRIIGSKYLCKWRGVSIGTGLYFNRNVMDVKLGVLNNIQEYAGSNMAGYLYTTVSPDLKFRIESNTAVIPIEARTSIQLLWFLSLNAGIGVNLNIGQTTISTKGNNAVYETVYGGSTSKKNAELIVDASTSGVFGRVVDMRFILGAGINIGPAVLGHVDFSYYVTHGFSVNVSAGFVW